VGSHPGLIEDYLVDVPQDHRPAQAQDKADEAHGSRDPREVSPEKAAAKKGTNQRKDTRHDESQGAGIVPPSVNVLLHAASIPARRERSPEKNRKIVERRATPPA
jgi:hypothetical protein